MNETPRSRDVETVRRFGPLSLLLLLLVGLAGGIAGTRFALRGGHAEEAPATPPAAEVTYMCPMHPTITSDRPADCPICGMKLVLIGKDQIPASQGELEGGTKSLPGLSTVHIDPARQQLIGLRTARVIESRIGGSWRTVGRVGIDETRVRHVNVKVEGFVDRIFVDFVGKSVRRGEPLFSLYSPELLSLQNEYLLAKRMSAQLEGGQLADSGADLVASTRNRLALWDVPSQVLDDLDRTGQPTKSIVFHSPISGVVTMKDIVDGHRLAAGDVPYEISDLTEVWVLIDVHEGDLSRAAVGMEAAFTPKAYPNDVMNGRVVFIDPVLNPDTRTARARLSFANPQKRLLPEMFGDVMLRTEPNEALTIPADAVIDSGVRKIVFVSLGDGKFEPREVHVGAMDEGNTEVLDGVVAGELVVVRANFLVDSESRLRASLAAMSGKQP